MPRGHILPLHAAAPLVLGSTSRYRRELLSRLRLPFEVALPRRRRDAAARRAPAALALRLALAKAARSPRNFPTPS